MTETAVIGKPETKWVGMSVARADGIGKVTGETKFFSDMALPNMLWAKVVRSKHPHARIRGIDTSRAEALPGVVTVLTWKDVPGVNSFGGEIPDEPVLCKDKVRYEGDSIALIAAESKEAAETAAELVMVNYQPLPTVHDPVEAMKPESPRVHEQGNILKHVSFRRGDVEKAFQSAEVIVENTFRTGRQMHMYLETEAGIGTLDEEGKILLYTCGQSPYRDQMQISRALDIPPEQIRIISTPVGGAFGGKEDNTVQIHLAMLVLKTKRPVKMVWTREESGITGIKRHPMIITMKIAADEDGKLLAVKVKIISDTGAYASFGPSVLEVAVENAFGPYSIDNVDVDAYCVYTNNGIAGAFRGFGVPQVNFAMETTLDIITERLRMNPLEIRKMNILRDGGIFPLGNKLTGPVGIHETLAKVEASEIWRNRIRYKTDRTPPWIKRGIGVAAAVKGYGFGCIPEFAASRIELTESGKYVVAVSCPEFGQGSIPALSQIAADALHCDIADIEFESGDSGLAPDTGSSSASMGLVRGGRAIIAAAEKMMNLILDSAAEILVEPKETLKISNSVVSSVKRNGKSISLREIEMHMTRLGRGTSVIAGTEIPRYEKPLPGCVQIPHMLFMFASAVALVEVNTLTGVVRVLRFFFSPESGTIVNPQSYTGQCEGAIVQGLGFALTEDTLIDHGHIKTNNFTTYVVPTLRDIPEIQIEPVVTYDKTGPFGAKGLGENGIVPVGAAIANAIHDATGVRVFDLPATPQRVYTALKENGKLFQ